MSDSVMARLHAAVMAALSKDPEQVLSLMSKAVDSARTELQVNKRKLREATAKLIEGEISDVGFDVGTIPDIGSGSVLLRLFNGARTKEAWNSDSDLFVDDWKPVSRYIRCHSVHWTYGTDLRILMEKNNDPSELEIDPDGYVLMDGIYYGDWELTLNYLDKESEQKGEREL